MNFSTPAHYIGRCESGVFFHEGTQKLITSSDVAGTPPPNTVSIPQGLEADRPLRTALIALDDAKAEQILAIDLRGKTSLADSMVIASGRSDRHVAAIAERVIQACKDAGIGPVRVEGLPSAEWVLIDCGDVLVHVFKPEVRGFYNLEKIWGVDRPSEISGPQDERARIRRVS